MSSDLAPAPAPALGAGDRYSMRQARALTGVADRSARNTVSAGYLPRSDLTLAQVLALQALDALAGFSPARDPRLAGVLARELVQLCERALDHGDRQVYAVISASHVRWLDAAHHPDELAVVLSAADPQPYVLLPLGAWAHRLLEQTRQTR